MKILIIEDEFILSTDLSAILEEEGYSIVGVYDNGQDAYRFFRENDVDLILCDININGDWDGIETMQKCISVKQVPIIYLTALTDKETIGRAKETMPAAYISKPFNRQNLRIAIEMAINNFAYKVKLEKEIPLNSKKSFEAFLQVNNDIFVKQNYHFVKFKIDEILYLESDNIHTNIFANKKYAIRQSLGNTLDNLGLKCLVRVHRSFAVNIDKIDRFNENEIFIQEHIIPIGRSYKEEFMSMFNFK
ncbi:response regulator [Lacihabitans sp. LS3-19]|uniref:response regulator n=1 Tax=Lacihabitans sp. LS3-19 TaxID=2487335 RepID=UPI0020CF1AB1|nr:response regulator [Lacihabitans sp. LS3-19]MCP9767141.1 response regulator [Lacihabitans sp. LS3-19]